MAPLEKADTAAEHYLGIGGQCFGQIGLVEPDHADIARLIAHDGLGAAPAARPGLLRLPDVGHDGLLLALGKLRDELQLAVVEVAVGEEIEQVAHRLHAQLAEFGGKAGADTLDDRYRRIERLSAGRYRGLFTFTGGFFFAEEGTGFYRG